VTWRAISPVERSRHSLRTGTAAIEAARQLYLHTARLKDLGQSSPKEASMAKVLGLSYGGPLIEPVLTFRLALDKS
jgi:alkylation response protein AidB-like acyl-CoA dehydrogenase